MQHNYYIPTATPGEFLESFGLCLGMCVSTPPW